MKKRITIVVVAALALPLSLAASVFGGGDNGLEKADQARQKQTDNLIWPHQWICWH